MLKCPKCKGKMEKGNFSGSQIKWLVDEKKSFLKSAGKDIKYLSCEKCGFIECYVDR